MPVALTEKLAAMPGTQSVGVINGRPLGGSFTMTIHVTGGDGTFVQVWEDGKKLNQIPVVGFGRGDRKIEVPADKINLEFVLGNKVMVGTVNANREYFESGVRDLSQAELEYPGWLKRLLTHPVKGLANYQELFEKLRNAKGAIKIFCEVAEL